jgi:hypothetical protein
VNFGALRHSYLKIKADPALLKPKIEAELDEENGEYN